LPVMNLNRFRMAKCSEDRKHSYKTIGDSRWRLKNEKLLPGVWARAFRFAVAQLCRFAFGSVPAAINTITMSRAIAIGLCVLTNADAPYQQASVLRPRLAKRSVYTRWAS
ncbi:MAG TPA: hypothetical protein VH164_16630, partial [Ktedonobacteraceae bacterium]|nr:hypothetical protein [Ktedonobacteraceae bacterium]